MTNEELQEILKDKLPDYTNCLNISKIDEEDGIKTIKGSYESPCGCSEPENNYICCYDTTQFEVTLKNNQIIQYKE